MKLVFEGGPAVGKSTVSKVLERDHHCQVIPEVNVLFGKNNNEHPLCYYQKQIERWNIATRASAPASLTILDGDIFQPVWFNSLFPNEDWGNDDEMIKFYLTMLKNQKIAFPDKYVFFHIDEKTRGARERERSIPLGKSSENISKKIARYRQFSIEQYAYFLRLSEAFPDLVVFIEANDIAESVAQVLLISEPHHYKNSDIFKFILDWKKNT